MAPTPTTRWSLIQRTRVDGDDAQRALAELCTAYRPVVLRHLRRLGGAVEAEDLTQAFFVHFLEKQLSRRADAQRGSFRAFLFTAVHNHHRQALRQARAARHGPAAQAHEDVLDDVPADSAGPDQAFDHDWACHVLARAEARLADEATRAGKGALFAALRPCLAAGPEALDYPTLGATFGMPANTLAVAVRRLRERLRALVRRELADTLLPGADLDAELEWFKRALRG